tara:strand:+ start:10277 stop:11359 length:1083 start_codon:yes stop_codon:yes gene_type:complete
MKHIYNFAPGPALLPQEVMVKAKEEFLDWNGLGLSVMEVSHRSKEFIELAEMAENNLRMLLKIPNNYKVLFLQGGATLQFAAIPLNIAKPDSVADYLITGSWGKKSAKEAKSYVNVNIVADAENSSYTTVPELKDWKISDNASYFHYTPNETIAGVEITEIPNNINSPIVADMSSTILSRPIDVTKFGLIYAGAQKNIGPSGLTIVIVREDLILNPSSNTPGVINYKLMSENDSMWNTPPTFSWYMAGLVLDWINRKGGLHSIEKSNLLKSNKIYNFIDSSEFYINRVNKNYRSRTNIPFTLLNPELDPLFLMEASEEGLVNLKGHRSVGGMRASIYNAMPVAGVDKLVSFMKKFESKHE